MSHDVYESPLAGRYASPYMLHLFSADMRFQTWRRLWTALARAEHELGLPITAEQVAELEAHITDIDYETAAQREREGRFKRAPYIKNLPLHLKFVRIGKYRLMYEHPRINRPLKDSSLYLQKIHIYASSLRIRNPKQHCICRILTA